MFETNAKYLNLPKLKWGMMMLRTPQLKISIKLVTDNFEYALFSANRQKSIYSLLQEEDLKQEEERQRQKKLLEEQGAQEDDNSSKENKLNSEQSNVEKDDNIINENKLMTEISQDNQDNVQSTNNDNVERRTESGMELSSDDDDAPFDKKLRTDEDESMSSDDENGDVDNNASDLPPGYYYDTEGRIIVSDLTYVHYRVIH